MTPWPRWDFRLAADILDRFAEDLKLEGRASLEHTPLDQQGVSARPHSLDETLTDLRLSPFPSLVIGVEGATEYKLIPRVLDLLEIELDRNWGEDQPATPGETQRVHRRSMTRSSRLDA